MSVFVTGFANDIHDSLHCENTCFQLGSAIEDQVAEKGAIGKYFVPLNLVTGCCRHHSQTASRDEAAQHQHHQVGPLLKAGRTPKWTSRTSNKRKDPEKNFSDKVTYLKYATQFL